MMDIYPFNGTLDGELKFFMDGFNPFDDIMDEEFEFFEGDPEALDSWMVTQTNWTAWMVIPTQII
jgi:hypothetical protein